MIKQPRSTKSVVNPYLVEGTAFDDLSPANRIAHTSSVSGAIFAHPSNGS